MNKYKVIDKEKNDKCTPDDYIELGRLEEAYEIYSHRNTIGIREDWLEHATSMGLEYIWTVTV